MKKGLSRRARAVGILLLVAAAIATAALTATSRAGSIRTEAHVTVLPHTVSTGEDGFFRFRFTNRGPSAVNHVFATVSAEYRDADGTTVGAGPLPLPASAFSGHPLSDPNCEVNPVDSDHVTLTCDLGQVKPGPVVRDFEFTAPAAFSSFPTSVPGATVHAHVDVSFDESKGTQLPDKASDTDRVTFAIAASDGSAGGKCTDAAGTLTATDTAVTQRTFVQYGTPSIATPCIPASAGVFNGKPAGLASFSKISWGEFLDSPVLTPVDVYFFVTPPGVTKKSLQLYELANFPLSLVPTLDHGKAAVPVCVLVAGVPAIPSGSPFHSCVVSVESFPGGGLLAHLVAQGGTDPGWGGVG